MKKVILFMAVMIVTGLCSGCSNDQQDDEIKVQSDLEIQGIAEKEPIEAKEELPETNSYLPQYSDKIKLVPSETEKNEALEDLIIETWDIPEDYFAETYYYYNYVDINNDGENEIFAYVMGTYTSGSGGSSALIATVAEDESLETIQTFSVMNNPIIISDELTNDFNDIIVYYSGGGAEGTFVELKNEDGTYPNVADGMAIDTIDSIEGSALIYNDFLSDKAEGTVNSIK